MVINEIFYSLQGEGQLAGVPSVFIRMAGCPLRCKWCDTKYAWDDAAGTELATGEILERISVYPTRFAVVTGGEPMVGQGIGELITRLHENGYHITVETAGIEYVPGLPVELMSISPKLGNSLADSAEKPQHTHFDPLVLEQLTAAYDYQLKFVVDQPDDLNEIAACLEKLKNIDPYKICLMPQATELNEYLEKSRWLADYCMQTGFGFSPRLQVMLWPGQKGK
ncbi:MAG: 7-carboxy-7-deazaguanine synthase QueE [Planctomycetes bacterium]|nr:7-carboxy-7-deazaguanine synthase QueE [Planctomycetota bacterium]